MKMITIAVDAMGSDDNVAVEVWAVNKFIKEYPNTRVVLYGDEKRINEYLEECDRVDVVHCNDIVSVEEEPVAQIKGKKDASMVVAMRAVKEGECDCFVSAGSTGGIIAGGLLIVGRIKGIKRPALAPVIPSMSLSPKVMLDVGANDEVKPLYLLQNAKMGIEYLKALGVPNPTVALLNIGTESKKGPAVYQEVYKDLMNDPAVNFVGNIEGRDIVTTDINVIVTDGFSGNIALKTMEGTAKAVSTVFKQALTKSFKNKLMAALLKKDIKHEARVFEYREVGGSILIGCKNVIVKAHGSSDAYSFYNAIKVAYNLEMEDIVKKIESTL